MERTGGLMQHSDVCRYFAMFVREKCPEKVEEVLMGEERDHE